MRSNSRSSTPIAAGVEKEAPIARAAARAWRGWQVTTLHEQAGDESTPGVSIPLRTGQTLLHERHGRSQDLRDDTIGPTDVLVRICSHETVRTDAGTFLAPLRVTNDALCPGPEVDHADKADVHDVARALPASDRHDPHEAPARSVASLRQQPRSAQARSLAGSGGNPLNHSPASERIEQVPLPAFEALAAKPVTAARCQSGLQPAHKCSTD